MEDFRDFQAGLRFHPDTQQMCCLEKRKKNEGYAFFIGKSSSIKGISTSLSSPFRSFTIELSRPTNIVARVSKLYSGHSNLSMPGFPVFVN